MPRCQRTFQRISPSADSWVCPHCPDAETYAAVRDTELLQYARLAEAVAIEDFGRPDDVSRSTFLLLGLRPECVLEPVDRRYDIYLQQKSDSLQLRLQIGHEIFHRICSQGRIFHWTHEMLACLFSVRLLRQQGFEDYAAQCEREYQKEAEICPSVTLFTTDLWKLSVYPPGFYGRAYETGAELKSIVGWHVLCRLARFRAVRGVPDVSGWIDSLPETQKESVRCLLRGDAESV